MKCVERIFEVMKSQKIANQAAVSQEPPVHVTWVIIGLCIVL